LVLQEKTEYKIEYYAGEIFEFIENWFSNFIERNLQQSGF